MKKIRSGLTAFLFGLLFVSVAGAQSPSADLGVELIQRPGAVTPGSADSFIYRLTNHGPDAAGTLSILSFPVEVFSDSILELPSGPEVDFYSSSGSGCRMILGILDPLPGEPPRIDYINVYPILAAGESVECEVFYRVNSALGHNLSVSWTSFSYRDEDPRDTNNSFVVVFGPAPPIPTLSPVGTAILILSLFLAFTLVQRFPR